VQEETHLDVAVAVAADLGKRSATWRHDSTETRKRALGSSRV
jgi:hypothetical protein